VTFDVLWRGNEDLRGLPLVERKQELRRVLGKSKSPSVLYADHLDGNGIALYDRACELDIEGIVAKHSWGRYTAHAEGSTWFKVRNRSYSQWIGRDEAFARDRHREPTPGWHCCELALDALMGARNAV
jgi:ATP-dependent DNA ligase